MNDYERGVMFYMLPNTVPLQEAWAVVEAIAVWMADPVGLVGMPPFLVRSARRVNPEDGGSYWIGFNDGYCGRTFERLIVSSFGKEAILRRSSKLPPRKERPDDDPNPILRPVLSQQAGGQTTNGTR